MTGLLPFSHLKRTTEVLIAVQKGVRPRKPTDPEIRARGLDDGLWSVLTECWMANPFERPAIDKVFAVANAIEIHRGYRGALPPRISY